jgi:RNA polymerase sigma-54 factor
MKLGLDLRTTLTQTLTPQQIQYLKLLQLPVMQLEQQVRQEIEQNPMLDEFLPEDQYSLAEEEITFEEPVGISETVIIEDEYEKENSSDSIETIQPSYVDDTGDPFEFYKLLWQEGDDSTGHGKSSYNDDDDGEPFQIKYHTSLIEDLLDQFRLLELTDEEYLLGEQIIGSIDTDGYLRRDLLEILEDTNELIEEINSEKTKEIKHSSNNPLINRVNPAKQYAISDQILDLIDFRNSISSDDEFQNFSEVNPIPTETSSTNLFLKKLNLEQASYVLEHIQSLEPPGIAARSIQECLIAQCKLLPKPNAAQKLALEILDKAYDSFVMKHYNVILKQFEVTEEYLRQALDVIRRLNPKPGGGEAHSELNSITPDFIIERDDKDEIIITVNDSRLPALQLNKAYEKLKKEARYHHFNKDTREWIRTKYEDAKFLIQAIRQRKNTMLKVMTAIAGLQKDFFYDGPSALKPLIYRVVSENTGLDISTVCRIVNGKYVQTEFGIFELKYFFSESLPNEDGEEISTTVIKQIIRDIIDTESKDKPFSDDKICLELKKRGYNVARRTVAKYREQLRIPVARLRKEL